MSKFIFLLPLLVACTTERIVYREVPYEVEKIVYCAGNVEHAEYEVSKMKQSDSASLKVNILLIERQQRINTEGELRAELSACQVPKNPNQN